MAKKLLVVSLCLISLFTVACGEDADTQASGGSPTEAEGQDSEQTNGAPASVEVTTSEFTFKPSKITVAAGGVIELSNEDDAKHSLTASEAGVDEDVDPNASVTIRLGQVDPGTYDYVCKYHSNMTGTLEVTS